MIKQNLSGTTEHLSSTVLGNNKQVSSTVAGTNKKLKSNLESNDKQINSTILGGNNPNISSTLEKSVEAIGDYVEKRLSIYPQSTPTKENRKSINLYIDNNGQSQRISLQQIKDMSTKILVADNAISINNLDNGDFIISKE